MEFMEGIEVLSEFVETGGVVSPLDGIGLGLLLFGATFALFGWCMIFFSEKYMSGAIITVFGLLFLAFSLCIGICAPREQTKCYKVTIDESVSFVEFQDRYEILEQDGKIYVICEKEK